MDVKESRMKIHLIQFEVLVYDVWKYTSIALKGVDFVMDHQKD
jgi:hypothetical protein